MSVPGDGVSPVGGNARSMSGWAKIALGVGVCAAIAVAVIMPGGWSGHHPTPEKVATEDMSPPPVKAFEPATQVASLENLPRNGGGQQQGPHRYRMPPPLEIGSYVVVPPIAPTQPAAPAQSAPPTQEAPAGVVYRPGAPPPPPPARDSLNGQLGGATMLEGSTAGIIAHPEYTITAGAKIPCLPVEAADSSLGGFYTCRVPSWFRGTTETRGLLPPGTLIFGKIEQGLDHGQERLGIIFTRIETAGDHFAIRLAAPAADTMGRSGVAGDLHTFFWDRAAAVALYALLEGVQNGITQGVSSGLNSLGGGGNTFNNFGSFSGGGGQSLAQAEFQNQLNRKPVIRRDQALPLEVSVGQDLDFFAVCQQRMRVNPMACPLQ